MSWLKGDDYYLHNDTDTYRIAKAIDGPEVCYTLWQKHDPPVRHGAWGRIVRTLRAPAADLSARNRALRELQDLAEQPA